jgi:hypothetical protein
LRRTGKDGTVQTRRHIEQGKRSTAVYSDCDRYRYRLTRIWDEEAQHLNIVMLNPSTASELRNDPTIERCERRTRQLGFGGFTVTNLFAWRATDPKDLRRAAAPIGGQNDRILKDHAAGADAVLAAWGVHGAHLDRHLEVAKILRAAGTSLFHLGLTKEGHPRHPLYVPYATPLTPW